MTGDNETKITEAARTSVSGTMDVRLRQISDALIRHLHAFIREVEPTQTEWEEGVNFLTKTGQMCSDTRQEFILLSDVLGASMLVDSINHRQAGGATESTVFGPFYRPTQEMPNGANISGAFFGTPMFVSGRVRDTGGNPVAGAVVDVWHADDQGFYDAQKDQLYERDSGRGWFKTDEDGCFRFWTTRPSSYPIPADGPVGKMLKVQGRHPFRPEHIHFMVQASGFRKLVTHIFARGDRYLDSDVVFGVKDSLVCDFVTYCGGAAPDGKQMAGEWAYLAYEFVVAPEKADAGATNGIAAFGGAR